MNPTSSNMNHSMLAVAALMLLMPVSVMAAETFDCHALGRSTAEHWLARKPMPLIDAALTMEQAECARTEYLEQLQPLLGGPIGYKVAAVTPPAQRDLGVHEPLSATYLAGMFRMLDSPEVEIPASYTARPIVEAKLMVTVRDEGINDAQTVEDAAAHLAYVIPSVELGDSLIQPAQQLTGPILTVYNVGTRMMLNGTPIKYDDPKTLSAALRRMTVTTRDAHGKTIEVQNGASIMGDPLKAVLWIVHDQNSRGIRLKAGDRLGLGALSRVRPVVGTILDTTWEGLQEQPVKLQVTFK